jgi:TonB family protein
MKTKLTLFLCLLFLASVANAQTPSGVGLPPGIGPGRGVGFGPATWRRYTVKGEEFSVALPMQPSLETRKTPVAGTNKTRMERELHVSQGNVDYSIYVYENNKPQKSLEDFIREQTANANHDFVSERAVSINGFKGKEYGYRVKEKPVTEQFFATKKRLYRFVARGVPADDAEPRRFFSSLAFGNKSEAVQQSFLPEEVLTKDRERIYTGRQVDTKARLITKPEPSYTESARNAEVQGTVVLKVVLAADGNVTNIRTVVGLPHGLTERSIEAARKIKFVPATVDGRPVSMWMQLEYNWNLHGFNGAFTRSQQSPNTFPDPRRFGTRCRWGQFLSRPRRTARARWRIGLWQVDDRAVRDAAHRVARQDR